MTMVSTGPISLGGNATTGGLNQSVNIELGRAATATINMNESAVRTLAGVASGAISMSNFYGKANEFAFTISTNQTNADLRTLAINAGWNQGSLLIATISGGVYISSNSTGTPGLTVSGSFPNGVRLTNNGFIIGMGGAGGKGANNSVAGGTGGTALSVSSAITITNNGTIGGGGGGGQGGVCSYVADTYGTASVLGAGGGGGRSGTTNSAAGSNGNAVPGYTGNIGVPQTLATAGTVSGAGSGGVNTFAGQTHSGGAGGGWGAGGGNWSGTAIGGWERIFPAAAGGGGAAVSGNSNITWLAFGTRLGAIS